MKLNKLTKKGFSLIELVIVVTIIGILAAIAIPKFSNISATAQENAIKQSGQALGKALAQIESLVVPTPTTVSLVRTDGLFVDANLTTYLDTLDTNLSILPVTTANVFTFATDNHFALSDGTTTYYFTRTGNSLGTTVPNDGSGNAISFQAAATNSAS